MIFQGLVFTTAATQAFHTFENTWGRGTFKRKPKKLISKKTIYYFPQLKGTNIFGIITSEAVAGIRSLGRGAFVEDDHVAKGFTV